MRRYALFHAGGTQHFGIAHRNQHRAFGVLGELTGDGDGAKLVGATSIETRHSYSVESLSVKKRKERK